MRRRFSIGEQVRLSADAQQNECYARFKDKTLTVTAVATAYMSAKEFYARGMPSGYHPGFDASAGCALYDCEGINCSLYDWELTR